MAGQRPRRVPAPSPRQAAPPPFRRAAGPRSSRAATSPSNGANAAGAHFLRDRGLIGQLVRSSGAGDGDLVLDLGAGYGAITSALARTGARVIAVERDPGLAGRLERRFSEHPGIRVVEGDLRAIPLPRREFLVVANPPFGATTALLRRLLGDRAVPLAGADLILAWGVAKWLTSPRPRDAETARWTARYEVRLVRRVAAASFAPAPSVDAAHIWIRPRAAVTLAGRKAQLPRWSHDRR